MVIVKTNVIFLTRKIKLLINLDLCITLAVGNVSNVII